MLEKDMLERDMQNLIKLNPTKFLGYNNIDFVAEEYQVDGYRIDLVFNVDDNTHLIVELQKGRLTTDHRYKILDYSDRYKIKHPNQEVICMVIANRISDDEKKILSNRCIEFKEIPMHIFEEFAEKINYTKINKSKHTKTKIEFVSKKKKKAYGVASNDLQQMLLDQYLDDKTIFSPKSVILSKYPFFPKLWIRSIYKSFGFNVSSKPRKKELDQLSDDLIHLIKTEGKFQKVLSLSSNYQIKITITNEYEFYLSDYHIGFELACFIFGWMFNDKQQLAQYNIDEHTFYNLERKYPEYRNYIITKGLIVEPIR